ncbi:hypothetical protein EDB85DRAFT_1899038 [Lactarius pseudohatsudake]|nr:hypothetical protein EDB85DRAFT_1899038 [Lactarius pseudohatsudake]
MAGRVSGSMFDVPAITLFISSYMFSPFLHGALRERPRRAVWLPRWACALPRPSFLGVRDLLHHTLRTAPFASDLDVPSGYLGGGLLVTPLSYLGNAAWPLSRTITGMPRSVYGGSMPLECCSVPSLPPSSRRDHQTSDLPPFTDGAVIGVLRREALASVRAVVVGPLPWWATLLFAISWWVSDIDGRVDGHPFTVGVPCKGFCGGIVGCVVKVTPSLQGVDHKRFRLYKPPLGHSIDVSYSLDHLRLTEEHFTDPLLPSYTVKEKFQEKFQEGGDDRLFVVDVIVCVDSGRQAGTGSSALRPFPGRPRNGLLTSVTFKLRNHLEFPLPPEDLLDTNDLVKSPDAGKPDFIKQLEIELRLHRAAIGFKGPEVHTLRLLKDLLGESFGEYFTESNDLPEIPRVSDLELLHYVVALSDSHLGDAVAFTAKPEKHIYSLLRRFIKHPPQDAGLQCGTSWSFGLVVEVEGDELQYKYTPQSDFSMSIGGFPHLVAEVVSDRGGGKDKKPHVIAGVLPRSLRQLSVQGRAPRVRHQGYLFRPPLSCHRVYALSERVRAGQQALHEKLSKDLANSLSVIRTDSREFPAITPKRAPGSSVGSSLKRKRSTGPASMGGRFENLQM